MNAIKKFMQDEEGAAAVEYGLMVALIAAVIIVAVTTLGKSICGIFKSLAAALPSGTYTYASC